MNAISSLDNHLQGKVIVPRLMDIDVRVRFDLWQNNNWLYSDQQLEYWYSNKTLKQADVGMVLSLNGQTIYQKSLTEFGTYDIHYELSDELEQNFCLTIDFKNLDKLPIRDNTGVFVSGMFEIQSINLQDIDITPMLADTMFGQDTSVAVDFSTPVYC
jgi:hypothetical protein